MHVNSLPAAKQGNTRNSEIEIFKIFGMFLIVLSHVVQTLSSQNQYIPYQDYVLDVSHSTTDVQLLALAFLMYGGVIGNTIFLVCSAWYLLDKDSVSAKKWFFMLTEVWVVSVTILIAACVSHPGTIGGNIILQCLMPTTFGTNWYITCYLLFYPAVPILNRIIKNMSKVQLLRCTVALSVLYLICNFVMSGLFYPSLLIEWIAIYFVVAYMKLHLPNMASRKTVNIVLFLVGMTGHIGIILLTNFLGLKIDAFSNMLLYWMHINNPFIILAVISLFNLIRAHEFKNRVINRISQMSMFVYILHENIILRTYYRPIAINHIYEHYGYEHVVLWMLLLAFTIFAGSIAICLIYEKTVKKFVRILSEKLQSVCGRAWTAIEAFLIKTS